MVESTNPHHSSDHWQQAFEAARREEDPQKLAPLVGAAENAIFMRFQVLHGKNTNESEAIARALTILRQLQVTKLNFPAWERETSNQQT